MAAVLALVVMTAWLWSPALHFGFVYDDHLQIESNPQLRSLIGLEQALREPLWAQLGPDKVSPYYRPLFLFVLFVQHTLFGVNPLPWHLVNIALHLLVVLTLFLFLFLHLGRLLPALSGACLFACSPLAAEVVDWISACSESLYTALFLLALCMLQLSGRTDNAQRAFALRLFSACTLALAVFAKETALVAVVLSFLYEYFFLRSRGSRTRVLAYGPLLIPLAVLLWMHPSLHRVEARSAAQVISTIPSILLLAFRKLIWPVPVSEFYDLWIGQVHSSPSLALQVIALLCIAGILLWLGTRSKFAAWALTVVSLPLAAMVAGIFFFRNYDLFHDRYLYLSVTGVAMLAAALLAKLKDHPRLRVIAATMVAVVLCAEAWQSRSASEQFRNDISLFSHAVQISPHNIVAWQLLAETALASNDCPSAIANYRQAQQLRPDLWKTSFFLGIGYLHCGMAAPAADAFSRAAAAVDATAGQAALAWYELGRAQLIQGDSASALTSLRKAASLDPGSHKIQALLSQILSKS